jgi:YidC/Oxa1 family membrane protein insertase
MKILRLLGLLLLFGPAFAIRGVWSEQTLNGTPVHVLSTTQVDIAFNNSGQIAGWFIKNVRGTQFHGVYTNAPNLVPKNLPLPGKKDKKRKKQKNKKTKTSQIHKKE